jgi:diguanylate cyclase (GGDEF)-like protein
MPETNITTTMTEKVQKTPDRELNVLYEVSCAMRTTLELKHILYIILTGVTSHTGLGYNRALLFLVNEKTRTLECKMAIGPESGEHANKIWEYIEANNQDLDDLISADKVYKATAYSSLYKSMKDLKFALDPNSPHLITQAYYRGDPWHILPEDLVKFSDDPLIRVFKSREMLIMPLKAKDSVNGIIIADNIYTQKPINTEDIRIFTMLANQAGLAIENSHLYEMVVHKSLTDPITSLWNHRFFQENLQEELVNSEKGKIPLTLAIIDIDNFKKLNDSFGHQHGDLILKNLATILKDSSRDIDYVCRYGGEEFAVILLGTTQEQGRDIAERLRCRIEQHNFPNPTPDSTLNITVSIGLATYPLNALQKEDLIASADKAMYIAKFSGKNKVCLAENTAI